MARRIWWLAPVAVLLAFAPPAAAAEPTLTVTPSAEEIVYGEEISFDVVVTGADGVPTGAVQFAIGGEADGPPLALADGAATFSPEFLLGVGEVVTVSYSGDAVYDALPERDVSPVVREAPTSTQLAIEPATAVSGTTLTVSVAVASTETPVIPVGSVQFLIDGALEGPPFGLEDDGRVVLQLDGAFPPGDYSVTARYADTVPPRPYFLPSEASQVLHITAPPAAPPTTAPPIAPTGAPPPAMPESTAVSRADLRTFGSAMVMRLKRRGLPGLTARLPYMAPGPGTLTQRIFAGRRLVAAGRRAFPAAGLGTLRMRLTPAGRRAVNRSKRVKLRIVTRFAPSSGIAASTTLRVTVKRRS